MGKGFLQIVKLKDALFIKVPLQTIGYRGTSLIRNGFVHTAG
jgi:hypothetical protein